MSENAKWYVVHTYSGYENAVKTTIEKLISNRHLEDMILDIQIPLETVTEINEEGVAKDVERKVFPGYVLVKMVMNDETWPGNTLRSTSLGPLSVISVTVSRGMLISWISSCMLRFSTYFSMVAFTVFS